MNDAVSSMLAKYKCQSVEDYENALKEIIQEIALLGLWRAKFFEKAAFYGGTALRIFHGLDRFSEDLDFSLLKPSQAFDLARYLDSAKNELASFGLNAEIKKREKKTQGAIQSAFIKTGTLSNMLMIELPDRMIKKIPSNRLIKIKLEVDTDPPGGFETEAKYLLVPIPFSVALYKLPDLFAGKMHAILCREWKSRVKGRDWYDFVWYVGKDVPVNLKHLGERMKQTGHLDKNAELTKEKLVSMLIQKIDRVDFTAAKKDVMPSIKDPSSVAIWSKDFFGEVAKRMRVQS